MRWTATFAPDVGNLRKARVALGVALANSAVPPDVISDVLLVLGELGGNAIRHARTDFTVSARLADGVLRLEVFDLDTRPPSLLGLDDESTSGRGLHLVSSIATEWGWQTDQDEAGVSGKVVWAEFQMTDPTEATAASDADL